MAEGGPGLDQALIGRWFAEGPDGSFQMVIAREGNEGRVVATSIEAGEAPKSEVLRLITARIEQQTFASVTGTGPGGNWTLLRYEFVTPDRLIVFLDNDQAWDDAVRNKLLPGDADEAGKLRNSNISASSEELRVFVQGYGSVIFNDHASAEFRRLPN